MRLSYKMLMPWVCGKNRRKILAGLSPSRAARETAQNLLSRCTAADLGWSETHGHRWLMMAQWLMALSGAYSILGFSQAELQWRRAKRIAEESSRYAGEDHKINLWNCGYNPDFDALTDDELAVILWLRNVKQEVDSESWGHDRPEFGEGHVPVLLIGAPDHVARTNHQLDHIGEPHSVIHGYPIAETEVEHVWEQRKLPLTIYVNRLG